MLQLKNIRKDYVTASETVNALKGVSISFRKREFVSILGPSGCGKTTMLNIIGGLDHYTDGDLVINGVSTKLYDDRAWDVYRNHRVGFIFQSYNLIPHQTVLGNVELALTIAGIEKEERVERAKRALDRVGLAGQYYKRPNQLSGGQCQRVAIARALVNDPEILLADEPTGALDTVTSVQIMELIKEIASERLVIMVTHNPELAEQYSTRIVRLLDGNIIEDTNPMTDGEEAAEIAELERLAAEEEAVFEAATDTEKALITKERKKKKEKAKMSFFTAFRLSLRNLLSKKGRTAMVGVAGSIGIIGIALVLAFSAGIKGYVAAMQDDMLSGNPIMINETTYDLSIISDMMKEAEDNKHIPEKYKVYIDSLIEYIATMTEASSNFFIKNDINQHYVDYIKAMPKEYYSAMTFDYGIDLNHSIYVDFTHLDESGNEV
ncbi:MAG: ABC transporter ATP-binding protein, partial [Clostridia bacterium]|nr:ABC transporter ATP-binding protein [Clostridia bacterium]